MPKMICLCYFECVLAQRPRDELMATEECCQPQDCGGLSGQLSLLFWGKKE